MAEKRRIIRLMFARIKETFYELSEEEQQEFMVKDRKNLEELGCKVLMMIDCRCRPAPVSREEARGASNSSITRRVNP